MKTNSQRGRRWALGVALVATAAFLVHIGFGIDGPRPGGDDTSGVDGPEDLRQDLADYVAALRDDAPYRTPRRAESLLLAETIDQLSQGTVADVSAVARRVDDLGYRVRAGIDSSTGRSFLLAADASDDERAWGMYVIDLSRPTRLVVEVPHPAFDLHTEEIGLELFRRTPGAVLAVAGTHRRVDDGAGDVAHRSDSMFHVVTARLAERGLPQVQLHGFHDGTLDKADIVLSAGVGRAGAGLRRASERLDEAGIRVCEAWSDHCGALEGRRNQQGIHAAEQDAPFVHVEMNRSLREDREGRAEAVRILAEADLARD
ncbi:hypothetical protein [Actinokineospora xionganensis]|uniref:hypothetical protein n=1 Tax=Actinokineospora xionganensis TaxID=2684470 RepID=UPI0028ABCD8C|nr:hypothetical protein [Actinokineospora xionganensis]